MSLILFLAVFAVGAGVGFEVAVRLTNQALDDYTPEQLADAQRRRSERRAA